MRRKIMKEREKKRGEEERRRREEKKRGEEERRRREEKKRGEEERRRREEKKRGDKKRKRREDKKRSEEERRRGDQKKRGESVFIQCKARGLASSNDDNTEVPMEQFVLICLLHSLCPETLPKDFNCQSHNLIHSSIGDYSCIHCLRVILGWLVAPAIEQLYLLMMNSAALAATFPSIFLDAMFFEWAVVDLR